MLTLAPCTLVSRNKYWVGFYWIILCPTSTSLDCLLSLAYATFLLHMKYTVEVVPLCIYIYCVRSVPCVCHSCWWFLDCELFYDLKCFRANTSKPDVWIHCTWVGTRHSWLAFIVIVMKHTKRKVIYNDQTIVKVHSAKLLDINSYKGCQLVINFCMSFSGNSLLAILKSMY